MSPPLWAVLPPRARKGKLASLRRVADMAAMTQAPIDVVYTWVDDRTPGYLELLNQYAEDKRDLNPNRTRDNLETLRFSLRSVLRFLPQVRRIYLLTARPQVPGWLDQSHPKIRLVHHDQVMAPEVVPTFSSFGIVSHLHLLPDLAEEFLYIEDDILLNGAGVLAALRGADGRPIVHQGQHRILPASKLNTATSSPWNLALAHADALLSERFGPGPRRQTAHSPQFYRKSMFAEVVETFPEVFAATRAQKFRSGAAVPPEVFIPLYLAESGLGLRATRSQTRRLEGYTSLENFAPWTWAQLKKQDLRRPLSLALNDSFGETPNPRVEAMVRGWLARQFPKPGPWENDA